MMTQSVEIRPYSHMTSPKVDAEIAEIFFANSSRQQFATASEKSAFFDRWTGYYFSKLPHLIWVAQADEKVVAYLTGCEDSEAACEHFRSVLPSFLVFQDQFQDFPAHLHMNTSSKWRGQGIGKTLLRSFIEYLIKQNSKGLHIVTSSDERNVDFYRNNQFRFEMARNFKDHNLLFMGRDL